MKIFVLPTTEVVSVELRKILRAPVYRFADSIDDADVVIVKPGSNIREIPLSKRSFYFPLEKLYTDERYTHLLLAQLPRDQTVWTRSYDFYDETPLPTNLAILYCLDFRVEPTASEF